MELGIFSRTYEVQNIKETYKRMKTHALRITQLNLSSAGLPTLPEKLDEQKIMEIKEISRQYGIQLVALSGTFNMIAPDESIRQQGCKQFETQCKIAKLLNIPIVTLCTGSRNPDSQWHWHDDNHKPEAWDDLRRSTETILRHAEDNGIILGVEPEVSNVVCTPKLARKYLDETGSEHLKIVMDGANLFRLSQVSEMEHVLREAFILLGKDIVLAHAKDFSVDKNLSFVPAGKGILDFKLYLQLLKQTGYDGPIVMHGLSEDQVPNSRDFLKGVLAYV